MSVRHLDGSELLGVQGRVLFLIATLLFQTPASQPARPVPVAGPHWRIADTPTGDFSVIATDTRIASRIYAGGNGIVRSDDYGVTWRVLDSNLQPTLLAVDPSTSARVYAVSDERLWRSQDAGVSWELTSEPPGFGGRVVIDAAGNLYGGAAARIYKSVDAGETWVSTKSVPELGDSLIPMAADPLTPGKLYAFAWSFQSFSGELFKTSDGGDTWIGPLISTHFAGVTSLAIERIFPEHIYAAISVALPRGPVYGVVIGSRDGGGTWDTILSSSAAGLVISDPVRPETIYVASGVGGAGAVFRWTPERITRLGEAGLTAGQLAVAPDGSVLYAILYAGGPGRVGIVSLSSPLHGPILVPRR